jgi:hypothetical protein
MLVVRTCFWLCLATMFEATLRVFCPTVKTSIFHPTSSITLTKSIHVCFPSTHIYTITSTYLRVDLPSYRSIKRFTSASFFYRYFRAPKNIKKGITNKIVPVFEAWKFSTMLCILKVIQTRLTKNSTNLINRK